MTQFHFYAGIGSRRTPANILSIMDHIGRYLFDQGWTLRSGAADGADKAFETAVDEMAANHQKEPAKEIYLPWKGFNHSTSQLHPIAHPFTDSEKKIAAAYHPHWNRCAPSAQLMHMRNLRQIVGCESVHGSLIKPSSFVVCWTPGGEPIGGTGQAIRYAMAAKIPVINLGKAQNNRELEQLVLSVDLAQQRAKVMIQEVIDSGRTTLQ